MASFTSILFFVLFSVLSFSHGIAEEPSRVIVLEASSDATEEPSKENISAHHTASEALPYETLLLQYTEAAEAKKENGSGLLFRVGRAIGEMAVGLLREGRAAQTQVLGSQVRASQVLGSQVRASQVRASQVRGSQVHAPPVQGSQVISPARPKQGVWQSVVGG